VIEITNANIEGLSAVCHEFGFGSLSQQLRALKDSPAHQKVWVDAFEEKVRRLEADVQALQGSHQTAATTQAGLESEVRILKGWAGRGSTPQSSPPFRQILRSSGAYLRFRCRLLPQPQRLPP
jgi:hypothetical protein